MNTAPVLKLRYMLSMVLILGFYACSHKVYQVQDSKVERIFISDSLEEREDLNQLIEPYKIQMANELDRVLTYAPVDLSYKGMNTPLGNVITDLMLEEGNKIYSQRHPNEKIDVVLMNRGGLRRSFTKGDLSVRSMYELMPFENEAVVVTMTGTKLMEMVNFLRLTPRNHPIAGISFKKESEDKEIMVGGELIDESKNYRVLTNDYLQKGGDQMTFFLDPIEVEFLQIKLRDMFIQHFEKVDTIQVNQNPRYL
ncbi:5'-nucleotidase C-terminal domain-containing protein [Weeksellaceae bacterium KMM 9713]|uniref:5'-nucleotidase C-terminal domain-containing protein n=1 Tax=Profundicola chukchiensis TaxID=2961959 RepID=A0A9X4MYN9_9FLAO|nr:5'-nucleotidase C-terminal domain-containing protein [Profundicola chukchiensis]MDG4946015.1 5'-nucleotidase C-terminal domain-containing protein [Profundicola chukchiensis]